MFLNSSGTAPEGNVPLARPAAALLPARPPSAAVAALPSRVLYLRVQSVRRPCAAGDPRTWFPPEPADPDASRTALAAYARAACLGCVVARDECLELALRAETEPGVDAHGVFGATAPWEREVMLRARAATGQAVAS
jgi:hypothetical protein